MSKSLDVIIRSVPSGVREQRHADRLAEMYHLHASEGLRFALLLTGEKQAAEDLVQEAFVRIFGKFGDRKEPRVFSQYLRATILNLARSQVRKAQRHNAFRRMSEPLSPHSDEAHDLANRDAVWRSLLGLPVRQRTAIYLRYYLDLTEQQAATEMECSLSAFKSLSLRAMKALRREMEK